MIEVLKYEELLNQPVVWLAASDIPEAAEATQSGNDVITPLKMGKEWLFEYLLEYQPKTANLLLKGDLFAVGVLRTPEWLPDPSIPAAPRYRMNLFVKIDNIVVRVNRSFINSHIGDPQFDPANDSGQRYLTHQALPESLKMAYYGRYRGLSLPNLSPTHDCALLPRPTWPCLTKYSDGEGKENNITWLCDQIPGVKQNIQLSNSSGINYFLSSYHSDIENLKLTDELFVKTHIKDGLIYHIKDRDVENTRLLVEPEAAIDAYCEHTILSAINGTNERFDFLPYTEEVNGRWGELPEGEIEQTSSKTTTAPAKTIPWRGKQTQKRCTITGFKQIEASKPDQSQFNKNEPDKTSPKNIQTRFGGQPDWLTEPQWPISRTTALPMRFIGQIKLADTGLQDDGVTTEGKIAYLFMADDDGEYVVGSEDAFAGENAVVIQPEGQFYDTFEMHDNPIGPSISEFESTSEINTASESGTEKQTGYTITTENAFEPIFKKQTQREAMDYTKRNAYDDLLGGNKLGGRPGFIQGDEFPNTNQKWYLALQLDSDSVPFHLSLGDSGRLFVYINKNGRRGYMNWQCS